jgi:hypothetical protein
MEKGKLKRVHYVSNLSTALSFLEQKKVAFKSSNRTRLCGGSLREVCYYKGNIAYHVNKKKLSASSDYL